MGEGEKIGIACLVAVSSIAIMLIVVIHSSSDYYIKSGDGIVIENKVYRCKETYTLREPKE